MLLLRGLLTVTLEMDFKILGFKLSLGIHLTLFNYQ